MEIKLVYLSDLKFNLKVWKRELRFHRNELEKFEKKLEDIARRNLGIDAMAPLEGFQNKIIREKEVIGRMLQKIRRKRNILNSADLSEKLDGRLRNEQTSLKDDMKTYIKLHYELKESLMDYFLKWL
jgi:predicted  nucleic acid-binding Zn-ribbon protein